MPSNGFSTVSTIQNVKNRIKAVFFCQIFEMLLLYFVVFYGMIRSMKLFYDRKSKDPTYYIQQGFRNGKKTTTKNIARIGKHSELLKITDDPLSYAKEQVVKYNEEAKKNNKVSVEVKIDFAKKILAKDDRISKSTSKNIGYLFLQQTYNGLHINDFFNSVTENNRITFKPDTVNKFLIYDRILNPGSKLSTFNKLDKYYEEPSFNYEHILRTMDILYKNYDEYITHLYEQRKNIVKRNTAVCYYDCTNYYCETEKNDEDYVDEVTHEIIKGLRKYGPSKEHRNTPIVEMGLFMDTDGIPLSMCIAPGSENEQATAIPLEKKLTKMFKGKKFIYCADGGLGSYHIRNFNSMGGRAFIVTQSIKKLPNVLKEAVFNDCDYHLLSSNKAVSLDFMQTFDKTNLNNLPYYNDKAYKVINADKEIDLGIYKETSGKLKGTVKQNLIITYSRKIAEYQRYIRNNQVERAKKILAKIDPSKFKKGANDVTRFIKKDSANKDRYILDKDLIAKEEKYDGFYAVATNLDDSPKEIIKISANRYKIEDCFRVMKTNFEARPIYHRTRERIIAHFLICYTALLIYRLLEAKLDKYGTHFTTEEIIQTLKNMEVVNVEDMFYMSTYTGSDVCNALNAIFNLELDKKFYQPKELNKKCKKIFK